MKTKVDKAIADMIKDGTYKKFEKKYFDFDGGYGSWCEAGAACRATSGVVDGLRKCGAQVVV